MTQRKIGLLFILLVGGGLFAGYFLMGAPGPSPLFDAVFSRGLTETGAENLVAAIYLDYRLFDTLLEALLLLVSVIGVSQFGSLSGSERVHPNIASSGAPRHDGASRIMIGSLGPVYLLIALAGVYTVVTGMDGPGGGFQIQLTGTGYHKNPVFSVMTLCHQGLKQAPGVHSQRLGYRLAVQRFPVAFIGVHFVRDPGAIQNTAYIGLDGRRHENSSLFANRKGKGGFPAFPLHIGAYFSLK